MTYFLTEKLLTFGARRAVRRDLVEYAHRSPLAAIETAIARALPLARREAEEYALTVQEPMPNHVREALDLEIRQWERLRDSIEDFRAAEPSLRDVQNYTGNVRAYLTHQSDLLRIEEEMLRTCVVKHYQDAIRALSDAADAVPL